MSPLRLPGWLRTILRPGPHSECTLLAELIERSNVSYRIRKTPAKIGSKETSNDSNVTILAQPRNLKTLTKLTSQRLYGFDIWGHACTMVTAGDFKFWHRVGACGSAFTRLTSLRVGTRGRPLQEHRRPHACCNTGPSRHQPRTPGQTLPVGAYNRLFGAKKTWYKP